ncbi:DNA segregation ATPase FtsK/SpoIIIE, S-DNA-T family [bacterium A37T11]|nr:DNA segregation ATPase FtsK/SpoIIIE, S-DNA-T family [bacterium A37T11]
MAVKGNQFKLNSERNGAPEGSTPRKRQARVKEPKAAYKEGVTTVGDKLIKILGLLMLIVSVFFLIAFTSYLFTWQEDQSYISDANGGWSTLFKTRSELAITNPDILPIQNWMGKFGALLANQFIYNWFGIASFLFVGILFIAGYRLLFKVVLLPLGKLLGYAFFLLLYISILLGFFHSFISNVPHFLEGEFGFWTNRLLAAQIGTAGVAGFLIFAGLTALIVAYNLDFNNISFNFNKRGDGGDQNDQAELPDFASEAVEFNLQRKREGVVEKVAQNVPIRPSLQVELPEVPEDERPANRVELQNVAEEAEEIEEPRFTVAQVTEEKVTENKVLTTAENLVAEFGQYDPKLDLGGYQYPHLDLLKDYGTGKILVNNSELESNKDKIVDTLANYNIEIDKIKATIGPTVTLYEIIPKPGIRISKIKNLEDDIALSLAALGIRIIAPMPGKGTIGIEVPNNKPEMVSMRSVMATEKFQNTDMDLPIALGKTISNEVFIADLAKMPHLLVAGATGQGKSVGINAILTSLLYKKHPAELKFVLVDPKKVELSLFKKIERHFLAKLPGEDDAIITDTKKVINTLNSLCIEMDQRYDLLKNAGVRNLKEYNAKFVNRRLNPEEGHHYLPFIVLIVDEFADLMMTAGKEVEAPIARLAQLARAVGIHLVIATQRPSVNIITGTIKANFPARLAFRVLSKVDSRTILDTGGADQLIGRGDMLLATGSDLIRIQCAFVDTPEVEEVSDFIGLQKGYPSAFMLPEYVDENGEGSGAADLDLDNRDSLFEDAARLIVLHQQGSTSLIQRKLKLGYNRAGRIIDQLEAAGIVGPFEGSKARDVLYPDEYSLEQYLDGMNKKDV